MNDVVLPRRLALQQFELNKQRRQLEEQQRAFQEQQRQFEEQQRKEAVRQELVGGNLTREVVVLLQSVVRKGDDCYGIVDEVGEDR